MDSLFFVKDTSSAARKVVRAPKVILVEGQDDLYFFDQLLSEMGADNKEVQTIDYCGAGELPAFITSFMKSDDVFNEDVSALLITGDADTFVAKNRYNVERAVIAANLPKFAHNTISQTKGPISRVGYYLLPDNTDGNLETLLLGSIPANAAAIKARSFVEEFHGDKAPKNDKRVAQAYLATNPDVCRGAGFGARKGYFDLTHPSLDDLKSMLGKFLA